MINIFLFRFKELLFRSRELYRKKQTNYYFVKGFFYQAKY
jgi:hypothetical protein